MGMYPRDQAPIDQHLHCTINRQHEAAKTTVLLHGCLGELLQPVLYRVIYLT